MRAITRPISIIFGFTLAITTSLASANVVNGGFETGDTSNWVLTIPDGGTAIVVTEHAGDSSTYMPTEGVYFLELKTDGPGSYTVATQAITMVAGETVAGSSAFDCKESGTFDDDAFVEILDATDAVIATPWNEGCASLGYGAADGPWTEWSFTATTSGTYKVSYRVANALDSVVDAYALFDGPQFVAPSVPVPLFSTGMVWLLSVVIGLIAVGSIRRRAKATRL